LFKEPEEVSKETSDPTETKLFPSTAEMLTVGVAVNPILVLIPA